MLMAMSSWIQTRAYYPPVISPSSFLRQVTQLQRSNSADKYHRAIAKSWPIDTTRLSMWTAGIPETED